MKEEKPLVSICIPTFNSSKYVKRAVLSAVHQTYKNIEIIVSDNASTDKTEEIVWKIAKQDPRVKFFRNETNIGSGKNFLKAFERAQGIYAQALGSDDWLSRNYVEEGLKNFEKYPDAASVIADIISLEIQGNKFKFLDALPLKSGKYSTDWFFRSVYMGDSVTGFISLMRREDGISAMKEIFKDPVNFLERGDRREPMDMPMFMEILPKYKYLVLAKKAAYIKTIHGKDHVGLQGGFVENPDGPLRYALALRKAFEKFFLRHDLEKHFKNLRFWSGLSVAANIPRAIFKKPALHRIYLNAVKNYFEGYSSKEKSTIVLTLIPYIIFRLFKHLAAIFDPAQKFTPSGEHFLTLELEPNFDKLSA